MINLEGSGLAVLILLPGNGLLCQPGQEDCLFLELIGLWLLFLFGLPPGRPRLFVSCL